MYETLIHRAFPMVAPGRSTGVPALSARAPYPAVEWPLRGRTHGPGLATGGLSRCPLFGKRPRQPRLGITTHLGAVGL